MRNAALVISFLFASAALAADGPVERWAKAVGGRERVAAIKTIYREATVSVSGYQGVLKVWHTSDGKYRKEEQVATFSTIETFDGTNGTIQQGTSAPRPMTEPELERVRSNRFANSNAVFFVFFPERRRGNVVIEDDGTIVMKPEGGIDWRVTLDPQTSLPKTMVHIQDNRTVTVDFAEYETVDGYTLEKEIHRSTGDPRFNAVIRFTKTVITNEARSQ